jgi:hypothetical protein
MPREIPGRHDLHCASSFQELKSTTLRFAFEEHLCNNVHYYFHSADTLDAFASICLDLLLHQLIGSLEKRTKESSFISGDPFLNVHPRPNPTQEPHTFWPACEKILFCL